jgi:hypothetical protein
MQGSSDRINRLPKILTEAGDATYFLPYVRLPYYTLALNMATEIFG